MKRCPKCNADYFDNMIEFCLEDGTRLTSLQDPPGPVASAKRSGPTPAAGVTMPLAHETGRGEVETVVARAVEARRETVGSPNLAIEIAPVVLALAHNWWQWLYLEKQYMSSLLEYILSANFLMWLLLLGAGAAVSLYSLRRSERKGFAYTGLVILAINLILFLVPRR